MIDVFLAPVQWKHFSSYYLMI